MAIPLISLYEDSPLPPQSGLYLYFSLINEYNKIVGQKTVKKVLQEVYIALQSICWSKLTMTI